MSPLFQAKVNYQGNYVLYDIFRTGAADYFARHIIDEDGEQNASVPSELTLNKTDGVWRTKGSSDYILCTTLGLEIDVFNNGYGDLLGRIGQQ